MLGHMMVAHYSDILGITHCASSWTMHARARRHAQRVKYERVSNNGFAVDGNWDMGVQFYLLE